MRVLIVPVRVAKTPKIQQCALHQNEILHITFKLLLTIRKSFNFSDQIVTPVNENGTGWQ